MIFAAIFYFFSCSQDDQLLEIPLCEDRPIIIDCSRPDDSELRVINQILEDHTTNAIHVYNVFMDGCFEDVNKVRLVNSYMTKTDGSTDPLTIVDTLFNLNTLVHELIHALNSRFASEESMVCEPWENMRIWLDSLNEIQVPFTRLFPAKEFFEEIPELIKDNSIYAIPYVLEEFSFAQTVGVFALLDEFNAYGHDAQVHLDLLPAYKNVYQKTSDIQVISNYVVDFENAIPSYYHFKYFILKYIDFARENHSLDYQYIQSNTQFWEAFNRVDVNFSNTLEQYVDLIESDTLLMKHSSYDSIFEVLLKPTEELIDQISK